MLDTLMRPWPSFSDEEVDAVRQVLLSNRVSYWTGHLGRQFEEKFAETTGSKHAVAVTNGTLALELALRGLGIGAGDEVIVTPRSFVASASCVIAVGAIPVFADIDPDTQNVTAQTIGSVITENTRAVICVHLAGWPCEMDEIMGLAQDNELYVIEDCAQAHGASYKGKSVGSIGHVGAWSFCQDKILTTGGEGGMVTTSDEALWKQMWSYKDHGKSWDAIYGRDHAPGFRWIHESFGSNWRMLEMQAAIGLIQLGHLPEWLKSRQSNAERLRAAFKGLPALRVPRPPEHLEHAYYRFYAFVRPDALSEGWTRDRIVSAICERGVPCMQGSCPEIYLEKAFTDAGIGPGHRLPTAQSLGQTSMAFLVHPTLGDEEMSRTADVVEAVMAEASES